MTESTGAVRPVAVIILGADAVVVAGPATPIQLWLACLAAGYDLAVPATWGDELIAAECLRALASHPEPVAVMCSCPVVARAMTGMDADVAPHLLSLVAPPVATARYLRRVYGERRVHITYAGACTAAADSAIDSWITPDELFERFRSSQIVVTAQPTLFESMLPPDRRRHLSQPGGLPTSESAAAIVRPRLVHALDDTDIIASLALQLGSDVRMLLDLAPRLGCACSGVVAGMRPCEARAGVAVLEPPRSTRPVMTDPGGLGLIRRAAPRVSPRVSEAVPAPSNAASSHQATADRAGRSGPAAIRRATHSPLSWGLRERAHPQPSTGARRVPQSETLDPVTLAARALERAAGTRHPPENPMPAATEALAPVERPTTEQPAVPAATVSRTTPPGGYWFAALPAAGLMESDVEIRRSRPSREDIPRVDMDADVAPAPGAAPAAGAFPAAVSFPAAGGSPAVGAAPATGLPLAAAALPAAGAPAAVSSAERADSSPPRPAAQAPVPEIRSEYPSLFTLAVGLLATTAALIAGVALGRDERDGGPGSPEARGSERLPRR